MLDLKCHSFILGLLLQALKKKKTQPTIINACTVQKMINRY